MWYESLSIVIPAYNEAENIGQVVHESLQMLAATTSDYEVIVVDDGSVDETPMLIDNLARTCPQVRALHHECNLGVGMALRTLFAEASKDWIFFIPGDGQVKALELPKFLDVAGQYDLVIGRRRQRADPLYRRVNARLYNLAVSTVARHWVDDVDSATLYRRIIFDQLPIQASSALVHAEVFIRAARAGFRVGEVEIQHHPRVAGRQTGSNWGVVISTMLELLQLWRSLGWWRSRPEAIICSSSDKTGSLCQ